MKFLYVLILTAMSVAARAQQVRSICKVFPLNGNEKWDYLNVNNNRLFVSHGNQVQILDVITGSEIANIKGLEGVHGIAVDEASNYGFISNGMRNNVVVFDNKTYKVVDSIPTGKKPDAIVFEPFSQSVIVGNGSGNSLTVIEGKTLKVTATIPLEGNPEYIVSDREGLAFVNIENKNEIAVIDMKALTLKKYIKLLPEGEEPRGLAMDVKNKLLFVGCGNGKLIIVDAKAEKVINVQPIGMGCDGVAYNSITQYIYTSNKDGTLSIIHQKMDNTFEKMPSISTQFGCKTLALDEKANVVYTSGALLVKSGEDAAKMDIVPGSFKVFVIK